MIISESHQKSSIIVLKGNRTRLNSPTPSHSLNSLNRENTEVLPIVAFIEIATHPKSF